jgi:sodium ion-translocating decarboxylase beta subunit
VAIPDAGLTGFALWIIMTGLALGTVYAAIVYRIHPSFLIPLAAGMILVNLPAPGLAAALAPFIGAIQYLWDHGVYPPLILFCLGAGLDLSYLIAHPRQLFLGLVNPLAFLAILALGWQLGLTSPEAGCGSLVGGGDGGLSAIFLAGKFARDLVGPVGLTAALLVGLLPWLQPPLVQVLTTRQERMIRMPPIRKVAKRENILFAVAGLVLTSLLVPGAMLLTGMFFLGNLLKESGVVERLARTLANRLGDILVALLGLAVGTRCQAANILSLTFLKVITMGLGTLFLITLLGVLAIKVANLCFRQKINPLVGGAALGLLPHAAQVVQILGRQEDPHNNLFSHALASSQAALLAATLTAGLLWSILGKI